MMEEIPEPVITNIQGEDTARLTPEGCSFTSGSNGKIRKVAIIGAGPAGLCAARHLFAPGSGFTGCVYEQAGDLGGTWLYSDATGKDRFGLPIHSTLYYDLWTNLPKETMFFPGFEYKDEERSYLPAARVLQYLVDYADHYNLHPHIKLHHHVTRVAPVGNSWSVSALELTTQVEHVTMFDAVMVCSGPNIIPLYPQVDGLARFSGQQLHSKQYRKASAFEGKRVLIIGLGPSGIDISFYLIPVAKQVIISHNMPTLHGVVIPDRVKIKPIVSSMQDKTVTFSDGTEEEVDVIIHCTGYTFHFPFLTSECGLIVDQYITPLYRHFINVEYPTMCIIGIPRKCPHMYMVDYQVRTFMKSLKGEVTLPSTEDMLKEIEEDRVQRAAEGQRKKDYHKMNTVRNEEYFNQLAQLGELEPVPPVILKIFSDAFKTAIKDFVNFRKTIYKILDNENFTKMCTRTSIAGVKFADDQFKLNQDNECLNEIQMKEVDITNEKDVTDLSAIEDALPDITEVEKEPVEIINKETQEVGEVVEVKTSSTVVEMKQESSTIIETTVIKTIEEHVISENITQKENGTTFRVEAIVEAVPPKVEYKSEDNDASECTSSDGDEEHQNLKNTKEKVNSGSINLELHDTMTKPVGGDEIVKIIQSEEGGGFR